MSRKVGEEGKVRALEGERERENNANMIVKAG